MIGRRVRFGMVLTVKDREGAGADGYQVACSVGLYGYIAYAGMFMQHAELHRSSTRARRKDTGQLAQSIQECIAVPAHDLVSRRLGAVQTLKGVLAFRVGLY